MAAALIAVQSGCSAVPKKSCQAKLARVIEAMREDYDAFEAAVDDLPKHCINSVFERTSSVTCLIEACDQGDAQMVGLLLARGADPNRCLPEVSPLGSAAAGNHLDVMALLLDRGARINRETMDMTAMDVALANHHREAEEFLRARGGRFGR